MRLTACIFYWIFKKLILPDAVWREVAYHRPSVFKHRDINFEKVNVVLGEDIPLCVNNSWTLSPI